MSCTVETLDADVDKGLEALPADVRARFVRICGLIEEFGHDRIAEPHVKFSEGIWEIHMSKAAQALYMKADQKAVVVRVFFKKPKKVPGREIDSALRQAERLSEKNKERSLNFSLPSRGVQMGKVSDLHRKWSNDPDYWAAYDELESEFGWARLLIKPRADAGLTQAELAERIQMPQSTVAGFEGGRKHPGVETLQKIAEATGTRLRISFEKIG